MAPESRRLPQQHLVLAGGGHSHALVLRRWAMRPERRPAALVTLVSRSGTAFYSGMVPGLVAGWYDRHACAIDLRRLCYLAGAAFVEAEITGLDLRKREVHLAGRPALRWDRLSLDVGAVTAPTAGVKAGDRGVPEAPVPVKPLEPFLDYCDGLTPSAGGSLRIRGGGAAAVELALALRGRGIACALLLRGAELHLGSAAANRLGERLLAAAGIGVQRHQPENAPADLACTGSRAPAWLAAAGLPVEPTSGRVITDSSLRVIGEATIFASGDCGLIGIDPRAASGVWAVRSAPVLATNLERSLIGRPLRPWRPQRRALQLLGLPGPPRQAVALWGPLAIGPAGWLWRWKEQIDRSFLELFTALQPMQTANGEPMACRGCAAKLAAAPLTAALARVSGSSHPPAPEDAVELGRGANGEHWLQSVDGFPALLSDPWLNARLTTLHACSDLWACGASVHSVQAAVTLPAVGPSLQEELLVQTLAGIRSVLEPMGASLIGGHTLEERQELSDGVGAAAQRQAAAEPPGQRITLVLTVNGVAPPEQLWPKGGLSPGDQLLIMKPIGSGVLFAAAMAGAARPEWIAAALAEMQRSQADLVPLLARHGCRACTDITGFGLLGHLGEMLGIGRGEGPPPLAVRLRAAAVPALAGALELLEEGFASSLAPDNAAALATLDGPIRLDQPAPGSPLGLLIDPQTCGPLLAALPAAQVADALEALAATGFEQASVIGEVVEA
ncbi:bifunctional NADH dehydrogenase FAD-containing subunit/selenide, water dikinase SelD [Synechococcus sp. CBW1002]|uniref:AIR synthase-related protein n=1 Tax=Synechococcus sp. CBW1002 TaxID=1353134 RepID=UPI0018CE7CBA|nr:AIR synthase-related protein [Synechococcus sp. CBW1002]QPN60709.1 bifunctional NADH dehydrogenase FAD-containing subunit/selenide, water dikinase SelD [Synechococcus sp. CBW1002]